MRCGSFPRLTLNVLRKNLKAPCRISVTRQRLGAQPFRTGWPFPLPTSLGQERSLALSHKGSRHPGSFRVAFAPIPESRFSLPDKERNIRAWDGLCMKIEPVFREAFDKCALLLGEHLDRPLQEIVGYETGQPAQEGILDETGCTQPALFAVEYALGIAVAFVGHRAGGNRGTQSGRIRGRLHCRRAKPRRRLAFGSHQIASHAVAAAKRRDGCGVRRRRPGARGDRALCQVRFHRCDQFASEHGDLGNSGRCPRCFGATAEGRCGSEAADSLSRIPLAAGRADPR